MNNLGTLYICDAQGNNSEPLNVNDAPYWREDALTVDLGDPDATLREATGEDGLDASVDYVAVNGDGEIVGCYKWVSAASQAREASR